MWVTDLLHTTHPEDIATATGFDNQPILCLSSPGYLEGGALSCLPVCPSLWMGIFVTQILGEPPGAQRHPLTPENCFPTSVYPHSRPVIGEGKETPSCFPFYFVFLFVTLFYKQKSNQTTGSLTCLRSPSQLGEGGNLACRASDP